MRTRKKPSYFAYKNDDVELVELGQFLRETTNYRVEREWHIIFERMTRRFVGYNKTVSDNPRYRSRNPDLILIDKKSGKLLLVIEIDGGVHDAKIIDTCERDDDYEIAKVPLLVISKLEIDTTIFDYVSRNIQERLG